MNETITGWLSIETIMFGLLFLSILLIIVSFSLKNPYKDLKKELDQLSMQQIQELYQIKRKLKILEEELLVEDIGYKPSLSIEQVNDQKREIHAIIKNQVWSLARQGLSIEQISKQSSLDSEDVQKIIHEFSSKGGHYDE